MKILDGNSLKASLLKTLSEETTSLKTKYNQTPGLAVILIGNNPASAAYVGMKKKACTQLGYNSYEHKHDESITENELIQLINTLNKDTNVHGILLQLPLPKHLDANKMLELISPAKDVDGFHPVNIGKLLQGLPCFKSCTPYGVLTLLDHYNIETKGKHIVILGRSNIVGKPLAAMLMQKASPGNATVTVCHSQSENLSQITASADILIAAIGQPLFVKKNMVKPNAVVIDVGINRINDDSQPKGYKLVGDVDYDEIAKNTAAITPVPGGVGPLTIAMLMKNTLTSFKNTLTKK